MIKSSLTAKVAVPPSPVLVILTVSCVCESIEVIRAVQFLVRLKTHQPTLNSPAASSV